MRASCMPDPEEGFQDLRRLAGSQGASKVSSEFFKSAHILVGEKQKCDCKNEM